MHRFKGSAFSIPSIGALFDAMGLEVVKDIITLDGNMEAGYIDVGVSTTTRKLCGDATYGVGLTVTLRLTLGEESMLTGVFRLLDDDIKKVDTRAMLFLPESFSCWRRRKEEAQLHWR